MVDTADGLEFERSANASGVIHKISTYLTHLSENVADLQDLELGAAAQVLTLVHTVGHHHLVEGAGVDALNGVTAQDAVGDESIHLGGTLLLEELGRPGNGVGGIRQIVNKNCGPVADIADQHHSGILAVGNFRGAALL